MKLTTNRKISASSAPTPRLQQLQIACEELQAQVAAIMNVNDYGRFLEGVYPRVIAGAPAVRLQLKFGEYDAVIYLTQVKPGVGKIQVHPPKLPPTERLLDLGSYAEWMSWLATISGTVYREVVWNITVGEAVESATSIEASDGHGVVYRVYEHTKDADHDEIRQVNSWAYDKQAIAWAKRHANTQTFLSVVKVTDDRTLAGKGNLDSEVIWKSWEGPDAQPLQMHGGKTLAGDVTVKELADLFRSAWETVNLSWGNTAEDLLEWQDAFYCDTKYREGVADYAIANIPQLQEANMSDVHVIADEDENSSELLLTIYIDGKPVDKIRTWYVHDRWDAFLDEL